MAIRSKTVMPTTFTEIRDNYNRLHPQFARAVAVFSNYRWFGYNQKGNHENGYIILLCFYNGIILVRRSRSGFGDGVVVDISRPKSESKLEWLEIRRPRIPAQLAITSLDPKITASNFCIFVAKDLSAHFTSQTSRRPPGYTYSKCSKETSQCSLVTNVFGLPHTASGVCIDLDKHITSVIFQVILKGKIIMQSPKCGASSV